MKKIGFLSFGHWLASPYSQVRSASDALIQSIELAERIRPAGVAIGQWPVLLSLWARDGMTRRSSRG